MAATGVSLPQSNGSLFLLCSSVRRRRALRTLTTRNFFVRLSRCYYWFKLPSSLPILTARLPLNALIRRKMSWAPQLATCSMVPSSWVCGTLNPLDIPGSKDPASKGHCTPAPSGNFLASRHAQTLYAAWRIPYLP